MGLQLRLATALLCPGLTVHVAFLNVFVYGSAIVTMVGLMWSCNDLAVVCSFVNFVLCIGL